MSYFFSWRKVTFESTAFIWDWLGMPKTDRIQKKAQNKIQPIKVEYPVIFDISWLPQYATLTF